MSASENSRKDDDFPQELDRDKEKDRSSKSKGSAKAKDLSHVPCKFFKVGSCTAGSSCPFSHSILEPGQHKEVCAWFVKGNCKFGHKCALAHILPGQSMSMDRKNKKAAQVASGASNTTASSNRDVNRSNRSRTSAQSANTGGGSSRNALLSGSTAPTRSLSASRAPIPMHLKATLSPSAPAPPVQDTDFASYGLPDESNKLPSAPAQGRQPSMSPSGGNLAIAEANSEEEPKELGNTPEKRSSPSPLPVSTPSAARRQGFPNSSDKVDYGPIGSPPGRSAAPTRTRINGFSPGTSPQVPTLSTSPFSAPGTQTMFMIQEHKENSGFKNRSGLSASLGAMMNWGSDNQNSPHPRRSNLGVLSAQDESAVEEGDLEEFIPSSLTDLLTPEERSRRFSRTNSNRPTVAPAQLETTQAPTDTHHRYSRSVPAPSLLQDIRSIWTDGSTTAQGSRDAVGTGISGGGLGNGTPSSFQSNSGLSGRAEDMLAPSNASAAFLPGLHHHYINAKSTQRSNISAGMASAYPHTITRTGGMALSPPRSSNFAPSSTFDGNPADPYLSPPPRHLSARPIVSGHDGQNAEVDDHRSALSPSTRALQAHAPGQSLPQGLAAGYSRIHALPPPPAIASPSTPGAFSPGRVSGFSLSPGTKGFGQTSAGATEWRSGSPTAGLGGENAFVQQGSPANLGTSANPTSSLGGLESMFSRLSYSAAARPAAAPSGLGTRNPSGRGYSGGQGPLSPLSGPVLTGDDDVLFSMDG